MITRSKLVEQLRDYQIRSQHRADVTVAILWALLIILLVISSYVTLYLRHFWLSFVMVCLGILLVIRLRISKQALARKRERRLLLPLSMWALLYPALGFQLNNLARAGLQLVHRLTSCHWWKSGQWLGLSIFSVTWDADLGQPAHWSVDGVLASTTKGIDGTFFYWLSSHLWISEMEPPSFPEKVEIEGKKEKANF